MLIENSVTKVTFRHHEAYPSDGIFSLHRRTIIDSFACILFLRQLHLDLHLCYFINSTLKSLPCSTLKSSVWLLSYKLTSKRLAETDMKMISKCRQNDVKTVILTSCTRVILHPSYKTTFPSPGLVHGDPGRVCKKKKISEMPFCIKTCVNME